MKKLIPALLILVSSFSFSQNTERPEAFSMFNYGVYTGINFSSGLGAVMLFEGKTNLSEHFSLMFSAGYSFLRVKDGKNYTHTYMEMETSGNIVYVPRKHLKDYTDYHVFPVTYGAVYYFTRSYKYPFLIAEGGFNFYIYDIQEFDPGIMDQNVYYNSYDELPDLYKNYKTYFKNNASYRLALGLGYSFNVSSNFGIETRYMYQINDKMHNTNQILVGVVF